MDDTGAQLLLTRGRLWTRAARCRVALAVERLGRFPPRPAAPPARSTGRPPPRAGRRQPSPEPRPGRAATFRPAIGPRPRQRNDGPSARPTPSPTATASRSWSATLSARSGTITRTTARPSWPTKASEAPPAPPASTTSATGKPKPVPPRHRGALRRAEQASRIDDASSAAGLGQEEKMPPPPLSSTTRVHDPAAVVDRRDQRGDVVEEGQVAEQPDHRAAPARGRHSEGGRGHAVDPVHPRLASTGGGIGHGAANHSRSRTGIEDDDHQAGSPATSASRRRANPGSVSRPPGRPRRPPAPPRSAAWAARSVTLPRRQPGRVDRPRPRPATVAIGQPDAPGRPGSISADERSGIEPAPAMGRPRRPRRRRRPPRARKHPATLDSQGWPRRDHHLGPEHGPDGGVAEERVGRGDHRRAGRPGHPSGDRPAPASPGRSARPDRASGGPARPRPR